jgi:outer membrane PBP1 activator LpoA protein
VAPPSDDERQVKPFAATLQELAGGTVAARLAEQLQELTQAVTDTGKKGTLTLQLTVAPLKPGNVTNLIVTAKTVVKAPEDDSATPSSVFFTDSAGNLTRDDPKQPTLPLRGLETRSATA